MSMFQKATKRNIKARVAFDGPSGSGKTWTALEWATVLGERIALIDTERSSAALYSDHFEFDTADFAPPYDPARLVKMLKAAESEGYQVVVIDSLSHFWEGEGGVLDIVDGAGQRAQGNSFAGWKVGTPALRHLVDTMLGLDAHLIVTMRSKMEYVLEEDSRGKKVPRKVGMAPVMRAGVEYEFTVVGDIDLEHRVVISKSRCDLLADEVLQPGRAAEGAKAFKDWLESGEPVAARAEVEELTARMNALPEEPRKICKRLFVECFGRPDHLLASRLEEARDFVAGYEDATRAGDDGSDRGGDVGAPAALPADDGPQGHDLGRTEPEPAPTHRGGETEASPAAAAAKAPSSPKSNGKAPKYARDLHVQAGKVFATDSAKVAEDKLDAIVLNFTGGRTSSTGALDQSEAAGVASWLNDVHEGRVRVEVDDDGVTLWVGTIPTFFGRDPAGGLLAPEAK